MSSTAIMPARAPASIAMLQTVIRPSIDSARIAAPANSIAWPVPPAVPIFPITASAMSLAVTPAGRAPSTRTSIDFAFFISRHCVASTCSTSEVPMPNASAANAPCVLVCESPQTTVIPGRVAPCSGPITWTMPWRRSRNGKYALAPCALMLASSVSTCVREMGSRMPWSQCCVGVLWSAVATIDATRHGLRPASRRPSYACGLVTSWTRCRSM